MKKIEAEQAEALKAKLPDFWLPSLTPTHTSGIPQTIEDIQAKMEVAKTECRGGGEGAAHTLSYVSIAPCCIHILTHRSLMYLLIE